MTPNPLLGIFFRHWQFRSAAFTPLKQPRLHWESFWLVMGLAAWLAAPWIAAFLTVPNLAATRRDSPRDALVWAAFFGAVWGFGNLTFGLSVRCWSRVIRAPLILYGRRHAGASTCNHRVPELLQSARATHRRRRCLLLGIVLCAAADSAERKQPATRG
jgi:hypothetical protein